MIFSKAPELGNVKTRLRPHLNEQECLSFHVALLKDALRKSTYIDSEVRLYLTSSHALPFEIDLPIFMQRGVDLGERMYNAFNESFRIYRKCVIIGVDSPTVPPEWIRAAFENLDRNDVVLGPTEDGGYYLIGMSRLLREPFHDISWSTPEVLQKTLQVLAGFRVSLLDYSFDVDEPKDLRRMEKEIETLDAEYLNNTKSWFEEVKKSKMQRSSPPYEGGD